MFIINNIITIMIYMKMFFSIVIFQFNSVQFIQFHQIHYKSKRPIGYRISRNTLYQTLYMKIQSTK